MPKIKPEIAQTRVARAKGASLTRCTYKLGRGGYNDKFPHNPTWDGGRSDCSGFISWLLMTKREPKPGRKFWIETTAIHRDATGKQTVFVKLDKPEPGCLVVYGDKNGHEGHIGVVVAVKDFDYMPSANSYTTIECASGVQGKVFGKAIRERKEAQTLFEPRGAIFVCLRQDLA
jgi:hypothetical protein